MQHSLYLVVVIAIGIGKSMLFMLLASVSISGVIVVIALLNMLQTNLLNCCNKLSISSAK
jgi:hypothetical protein